MAGFRSSTRMRRTLGFASGSPKRKGAPKNQRKNVICSSLFRVGSIGDIWKNEEGLTTEDTESTEGGLAPIRNEEGLTSRGTIDTKRKREKPRISRMSTDIQ